MTQAARHQLFTAATPTVTRIIPELAKEIGLNESIMLLQLDFWINHAKNLEGGKWWTYQSVRDMQEKAFPYWSLMTINRTVKSLETKGYITIGNFNERKSDNTRWMTLNYEALKKLKSIRVARVDSSVVSESDTPSQNDTDLYQNDTVAYQYDTTTHQNDTTLPEIPRDNTESKKARPPAEPEYPELFTIAWAKRVAELPNALWRSEVQNIPTHPFITAFEELTGVPVVKDEFMKIAAIRAQAAGYTVEEVCGLTKHKLKEKTAYAFSWMINDLSTYRMEQSAKPAKTPASPEQEEAYQAILREARAEREAEFKERQTCPAS